jgi:transposase
MPYRIAGIDVHKRMLAVVVADVAVEGEYTFSRRRFGTSPSELRSLAEWLLSEEVEEAVMESTAQYWRPVWEVLERVWTPGRRAHRGAGAQSGSLHLAQAKSNRGPRGRKRDYPDAERLVKRLMAQELTLSFVPEPEQRLWRTVMRRKYQMTRNRVQVHNRLEALLEEAHLKLSSLVSDLLGLSARRMLQAVADGETEPERLAALADRRLHATAEQCAMLSARVGLSTRFIGGSSTWRSRNCDWWRPRAHSSIRRWRSYFVRIKPRLRGSLKCQGSGWIRHSRSSPKWGRALSRFRRPSTWRPGWAYAPARTKAPG